MKKVVAIILCLSVVLSLAISIAVTASADADTVYCDCGKGSGTSYYCTAKIGSKKGYYSYLKCSVTGKYRVDKFSDPYTKSNTASGYSDDNKGLSITARCYARAENHLRVECSGHSATGRHIANGQ